MSLLIFALACGPPCGPTKVVDNAECPVSDCALECTDERSGTSCCVDEFGRGLSSDQLERLTSDCEGEACDASLYISDDAAVCIAQVNGLDQGIGACGATFWYGSTDPSVWTVRNKLTTDCSDGMGWSSGELFVIHATTGEFMGIGSVGSDLVCDD